MEQTSLQVAMIHVGWVPFNRLPTQRWNPLVPKISRFEHGTTVLLQCGDIHCSWLVKAGT